MLQTLRKFAKSWIASLFLGGLALSFAFWGIGDVFRGTTDTSVAHIGDSQISYEDFSSRYRLMLSRLSQQVGKQVTPEQARRMGIGQDILRGMISSTATENIGRDLKLVASDDEVRAQTQQIDQFKGPLGTFDEATFRRVLAENGMTEDTYLAGTRGDIIRGQLSRAVADGFQLPTGYARAIFAYLGEMRAVDYLIVTPDAVGAIAPPSDAVLSAYVKAHPERFSTPEYRAVTYAEIGTDDVTKQLQVSEDQIKQEYAVRKDTYIVPEKRDIEQIQFPTEAEAKAASAKIKAGENFEALGLSRGLKQDDLVLGTLAKTDIPDAARADAAFALPEGGVSDPVKTPFGWTLMRVTKITPGSNKTLDQARDEIKTYLLAQLAGSKLDDVANAFTDAMGSGDDIQQAAKKSGMHYGRIAAMDANGLAPDGSKIAVADNADFRAQVFRSEVGEESDPFATKDGHYYAIKVDGVTPPKLKPLDAVRADAVAAWTDEQRARQLQAKVAALAAQATKEKSLAGIAKTLGTSIQKSPALDRPVNNETFSAIAVKNIFDVGANGIAYGPKGKGGGYVIARVTGIAHPVPSPDDPGYMQALKNLTDQVATDMNDSFANAARDQQGVSINQKVVDQVLGEGT